MSDSIVINGRRVALSHDLQAADTDYIIICTKGMPLNKQQKTKLQELGVVIHEFVGDETDQVYLCAFKKKESLEQINDLDFVAYVGVYANEFAVPSDLKADARASTVKVDVLLHSDVSEMSDDLLRRIAEAANVDLADITVEDGGVQIEVETDKLDNIAALDEVRVLHTANEAALFNNVARTILNFDDAVTLEGTVLKGEGQIVCVADTGLDRGSDTNVHEAFAGRIKQLYPWVPASTAGSSLFEFPTDVPAKLVYIGRVARKLADDPDGHGTHVCGSVLGKSMHSSQGLIEGTAPAATLIMQSLFSRFFGSVPLLEGVPNTTLAPLFDQAYKAGARIHTNSWGSPLPPSRIQRPYDGRAESIDQFVWDNQDMTILFAAGNDGQDADLNGKLDGMVNPRSLGAEASAKNCITVGATENNRPQLVSGEVGRLYTYGSFWPNRFAVNPLRDDHMADNPEGLAAFSSRGPTAENRLKPDVVAPGTAILSARSKIKKYLGLVNQGGASEDNKYMYMSGTSMATPLVAGCCAVLRQALLKNGYRDEQELGGVKNPTGSLVKALLINGAVPIKGQYMPNHISDEPNPHSGFGRVALTGSMPKLNDPYSGYGVGFIDEDDANPFALQIPVPKATEASNGDASVKWTFKVTLVYADLPGGQLQNDLNLVVVVGEHERHGNQIDRQFTIGSTEAFDRHNNVEQVVWTGISASSVEIMVKPFRLMSARVPFAYAWKF